MAYLGSHRRSADTVAVVTGAGGGIGRAFARELARRGGAVVCADISMSGAEETVRLVTAAGGRAVPARCDVAVLEDVETLPATAEEHFGSAVTLVVNNAGVAAAGKSIGETPLDDWRHTLEVNLWGVLHGCHVFVPRLRRAGRGGIVNVGSVASFAAVPYMAQYNTSKAAVLALSETLSAELSGSGVVVTVVCPTMVKTNVLAGDLMDPGMAPAATRLLNRFGSSPDKIVRTTLDAHDRGKLHALPQWDARLVWRTKRLLPGPYTRMVGAGARLVRATAKNSSHAHR
jgi:NAD(P)-dependent dehydrogenase (short-subunit alcohol dehydrogenase family)